MPPIRLTAAHSLAEIDLDPTHRVHTAYIVVDVIRATTTLSVMFDRGARRALVARTVEDARRVRGSLPDALLAGEVNAVAPADFDHGNSPEEWGALDVADREILFSTANGARGLHAALGGGPIFAGALRNASAVCAAALAAAMALDDPAQAGGVAVICSGQDGQPAPDDSLCAGWLVQTLRRTAQRQGVSAALGPGTQHALDLLADQRKAHHGDDVEPRVWLAQALAATPAARAVLAVGLGADIAWCAAVDTSTATPMVAGEDTGRALVIVEQAPSDLGRLPTSEEW